MNDTQHILIYFLGISYHQHSKKKKCVLTELSPRLFFILNTWDKPVIPNLYKQNYLNDTLSNSKYLHFERKKLKSSIFVDEFHLMVMTLDKPVFHLYCKIQWCTLEHEMRHQLTKVKILVIFINYNPEKDAQ